MAPADAKFVVRISTLQDYALKDTKQVFQHHQFRGTVEYAMLDREATHLLSDRSVGSSIGPDDASHNFSSSSLRYTLSELLESFSSTDRDLALKENGVGPAAAMIKDAVLGYQDAPYEGFFSPYSNPNARIQNFISIVCGRCIAYDLVNNLVLGASWALFILTFLEPPQWCRDSSLEIVQGVMDNSFTEYGHCKIILQARGTAADGEENQYYYPSYDAMWVSVSQSRQVELSCVFIIFCYMILELGKDGFHLPLFFYPGYKRLVHSARIIISVCLVVGVVTDNAILNPLFRMILLGSFLRNFQTEFWTIIKMVRFGRGFGKCSKEPNLIRQFLVLRLKFRSLLWRTF